MTRFPGPRWIAVALAFPVAGYIGWGIGGPVDSVGSALIGGALTGTGIAAVQWWAAAGRLGRAAPWIAAGAAGYAVGLAAGAALVGYDTSIGALVLMGLVSGASLGLAQGLVLAQQGDARLAATWSVAMPALFALGWVPTTVIGVSVEDQFTVFGAAGSVLFMLASGLVLSWGGRGRPASCIPQPLGDDGNSIGAPVNPRSAQDGSSKACYRSTTISAGALMPPPVTAQGQPSQATRPARR